MTHLDRPTLAAHIEGRALPDADLHLARCPACRARREQLVLVTDALREIPTPPHDVAMVSRVFAKIDDRGSGVRRPLALGLGLGLVVGVALTLVLTTTGRGPDDEAAFRARGGGDAALALTVTTYLHAARGGPRVPLEDDALAQPGFGLSFRVVRRGAIEGGTLMVFGCDARGDVHWAVPTWDDAAADPVGLPIAGLGPLVDLPVGLQPEAPVGDFEVVNVTTPRAVGVKAIESLLGGTCEVERLATLGPGTTVHWSRLHVKGP